MPSSIKVSGVDLDSILLPRGGLTPIPAVGIKSGGVDISQRYAPVSAGSPYGTTNIKSGGVDIGTLFAKLSGGGPVTIAGTAGSYSPFAGQSYFGFNSNTSVAPAFGTASPSTFMGFTITQLNSFIISIPGTGQDTFELQAATNPGQTLFTSITVGSNIRSAITATYSYSGSHATWTWGPISPTTGDLFQSTGPYTASIA